MPFTPFHFGPGALLHAAAPQRISFWSFCAVNVLIDCETLYNMLTGRFPLHAFFHSYIGASLMVLITMALFLTALHIARHADLANIFNWQSLTPRALFFGACLGAWSHVFFDSIMHGDIRPLAPFSDINHLQDLIPLDLLHLVCVHAAILAVCILYLRGRLKKRHLG